MSGQGKRLNWRIDTSQYGGRKFEGGFLGKIIDNNRKEVYAGPDVHHSLQAESKQLAEARAQMICDAVNDHSKLKRLKTSIEALIYDIQGGMTLSRSMDAKFNHKTISERKLKVFINLYHSLFGVDLNQYK